MMEVIMKNIILNNGFEIPVVGSGTNTYGKADKDYYGVINMDTTELESAIKAGYRHFDTAVSYRNEAVIGKAVAESGIEREEFFLTSKIPGGKDNVGSRESIIKTLDESLEKLQTDYVDLYLIHYPWDNNDEIIEAWKVLEEQVEEGKIKSIGVSNFDQDQLQYLLDHATIKPVVNQVQSHPGNWNHDIIDFGHENEVYAEAWGPLSRVDEDTRKRLSEIGGNYGKSWAQVVLNYQIKREVIVIPKSHNAERQADNLNIFDFELSKEEIKEIASL